jgi:transglutaminase-like putative cysteine protease
LHRLQVHTLRALPGGDAGVLETLKEMRSIVRAWKVSPVVHDKVSALLSRCGGKDWLCQATVLHRFVRDAIRYQLDPVGVEMVRTPDLVLRQRAGDCDDKATLLATLLEAAGHPARFIALGFGPPPAPLSHVLVETKIAGDWVAAETTEPWPLGRKPEGASRVLPFYV